MEQLQQITHYITKVTSDERLKPIHLALSFALCNGWIIAQFQQPYRVSRKVLMQASRIRSKATYHRVIKDLQSYGYLKYYPSYHPKNASRVIIMGQNELLVKRNR